MKKLFNIFMVLLAFALATTAFVSCSSDSDDDDSSSSSSGVVAVWKSSNDSSFVVTFNADKTVSIPGETGYTYVGNPAADSGTVSIYKDGQIAMTLVISGNSATDGEDTYTRQ